ncbi:MAG: sigma 54-interacting transcriptional regulator [Candidatus Babeliales bacterium]
MYLFSIIGVSLFVAFRNIRSYNLPKILKKQLKVLVYGIVFPYIASDFIQTYPFNASPTFIANNLAIVGISTSLLTYALFYCGRKMMGLRFLNFSTHVQAKPRLSFVNDFKSVLEQFSLVSSPKELGHITQQFYKDTLHIPPSRTQLYLRNVDMYREDERFEVTAIESIVENFINRHENTNCGVIQYLRQKKILIYDEIAFSNFYEEDINRNEILQFLEQINADVFLPVYEKTRIIAYVIVERDARLENFYSDVEQDEMLVFASYLSNIINLQQNQNLAVLTEREKDLREELYHKHQEVNQYKESIRSFIRATDHRKIGIIFYKSRRFVFGDKAAKDLIGINPQTQAGHPLALALKNIARQVEEYRAPQTNIVDDGKGNKLVLSAIPSLENNSIIITVYYPEIADIIKKQIDLLRNPSEWDYLLYLETTESGKLINQLIPGSGEQLLNFKIELLKTALSKKALLLEMPDEDLQPTVEILNHISLREQLHILKIQAPEQNHETAIKLFGMNPLFAGNNKQPALLEKLNNTGTLFIQNIHLLSLETQQYLAEFIKYGYYHIFHSDKKVSANVRIICSTDRNLQTLVQEGTFLRALFNELRYTTLSMPPLFKLSQEELSALAEGFTEQALQTETFKNILQLTDKEKSKLIDLKPVSLYELKSKIQKLLVEKSKKNNIYQEIQFDPAYTIDDPSLMEAARLGKKALQDRRLMSLLWDKFKNQNQIASFLNVNRSSVNRRCKEYNLN